jgi:hypothetical protein
MRRCKSDHRWSAGLSERGVFPRRFEVVDVFRTDWPDLPILHPGTASEIHHAHLEPANLVLEKEGGRYVRARSCETSTIDPGRYSKRKRALASERKRPTKRPHAMASRTILSQHQSRRDVTSQSRQQARVVQSLRDPHPNNNVHNPDNNSPHTPLQRHNSLSSPRRSLADPSKSLQKPNSHERNEPPRLRPPRNPKIPPGIDDSMLREVVAPAGLYTPDGTYLPRGSHVALHTRLMQRSSFAGEGDGCDSFLPFRYCEKVAEGGDKSPETVVADKGQISAVQISGRYMPFGLGKHAW